MEHSLSSAPFKMEIPQELTREELKSQVSELKQVVVQQQTAISQLMQRLNLFSSDTQTPPTAPSFIIKPRDIPELTLTDLEGVEAGAKLALFIDRVEQVTSDEGSRLQVAKTRLGTQIVFLVQNCQKQGQCQTWTELKEFLQNEFINDMNVDRAWQEIEAMQYDWTMDSQSFSHEMRCKFALLETNFPKETFPSKDQTIKRKICQGLPPQTKAKLEAFSEVTYPLKRFLDRVEYERQFLLGDTSGEYHVKKGKTITSSNPKNSLTSNIPSTASPQSELNPQPVDPLRWEVNELAKKVDNLVQSRNRRLFCYHCQKPTHNTQDCWGTPKKRI